MLLVNPSGSAASASATFRLDIIVIPPSMDRLDSTDEGNG
jgi:hypothetical protein